MNCEDVEEKLVDYLEGTLPRRDHKQVQSHLEGCRGCEDRHTSWVQFLTDIKQQKVRDPGVAFWQEFTARVKYAVKQEQHLIIRKPEPKGWWKIDLFVPTFQWAVASAAVVVVFSFFLFSKNNPPHPSTLQQAIHQANLADTEGVEVLFDLVGEDDEGLVDLMVMTEEI